MKINNLILIFLVFCNVFTTHSLDNEIPDIDENALQVLQALYFEEYSNNFVPKFFTLMLEKIDPDQFDRQFDSDFETVFKDYNNTKQMDINKIATLFFNSYVKCIDQFCQAMHESFPKSFHEHFQNTPFNFLADLNELEEEFSKFSNVFCIQLLSVFKNQMSVNLKNKFEKLKIDESDKLLESFEKQFYRLSRNHFKSRNINLDEIDQQDLKIASDVNSSLAGQGININLFKKECAKCKKKDKLNRCSRCKEIYYCSPECQKADWKNHKRSCKKKGKVDAGDEKSSVEEVKESEEVSPQRFESPMRPSDEDGDETVSEPRVEPVD